MASTITTVGFDAEFPVAGQDNDSQGFRTNFNVTKVALDAASSEITTLQNTTAKLNADNDFNGSRITDAEFLANYETVYANGNITSGQNISWEFGHYQTLQVGADVTLTLADFPESSKMGRLRLQITCDGSTRRITWAAAGGGSFKTNSTWPTNFDVTSAVNPIIVDFWTTNAGVQVFGYYHGEFN